MERIIDISVDNEYVQGSGVVVGAAGSHHDVILRTTFGAMWDDLYKYAVFKDALGENTSLEIITENMKVRDHVYDIPIPYGAKAVQGNMMLTLYGYTVEVEESEDEEETVTTIEETEATTTTTAYFRVLPSDFSSLNDGSVDATLAQQLQTAIEDESAARIAADDALDSGKADKSTTYTKTEVDTALSSKADAADLTAEAEARAAAINAHKTEATLDHPDGSVTKAKLNSDLQSEIESKADKSTTYTKTEVDASLALKADEADLTAEETARSEADDAIEDALEAHQAAVVLDHPDRSVTTDKIADSAVTTDKIKNGDVTNKKLAIDSVSRAKIQDNAVDTSKLAPGAVTTAKIDDGVVTKAKLHQDLKDDIDSKAPQSTTYTKTEMNTALSEKADSSALAVVESIAKGANQSVSFSTYEALVNSLNNIASADYYNLGQNIMVVTLEVPDLWVSGKNAQSYSAYTFVSDERFLEDMADATSYGGAGQIQVGYFILSQLETQKVDLTGYYNKSQTDTLLAGKSNTTDVYNKTTSDARYADKETETIVDGITEYVKSTNLFDVSAITDGYYVDKETGELVADNDYFTTDYIPVDKQYFGMSVKNSNSTIDYFAGYDQAKNFVEDGLEEQTIRARPLVVAQGVSYVRISISTATQTDAICVYNSDFFNSSAIFVPYVDGMKTKRDAEQESWIYPKRDIPLSTTMLAFANTVNIIDFQYETGTDPRGINLSGVLDDNLANEYVIVLSIWDEVPILSFPNDIVGLEDMVLQENHDYEISIQDGKAVWRSWEV